MKIQAAVALVAAIAFCGMCMLVVPTRRTVLIDRFPEAVLYNSATNCPLPCYQLSPSLQTLALLRSRTEPFHYTPDICCAWARIGNRVRQSTHTFTHTHCTHKHAHTNAGVGAGASVGVANADIWNGVQAALLRQFRYVRRPSHAN